MVSKANTRDVVEQRIAQCIGQRGRLPNVVAVDYAEKGGLAAVLNAINSASLREVRRTRPVVGDQLPSTTTTVHAPAAHGRRRRQHRPAVDGRNAGHHVDRR